MNYLHIIKESGLKQNHIANKLGISPTLLSLFLHGKKKLTEHRKQMLDEILGMYVK